MDTAQPTTADRQDQRRFILRSLILGDLSEPGQLKRCLAEFQVDVKTPKRIALIRRKPPAARDDPARFQHHVLHFLDSQRLTLFDFIYPNFFFLIIDETTADTQIPALAEFTARYPELLQTAVGKSVPIHELPTSYRSARLALQSGAGLAAKGAKTAADDTPFTSPGCAEDKTPDRAGKSNGAGRNFFLFDQMFLELLLFELPDNVKSAVTQAMLSALSEEDLDLLSLYFEENRSLSAVADRLFRHKNSVQYALRRIVKKSGRDPRAHRDAVLFQIALTLRGMENP